MKHRRLRPLLIEGNMPADLPRFLQMSVVEWDDDAPQQDDHACTETCVPPDPHLLDPEPYAMGAEL